MSNGPVPLTGIQALARLPIVQHRRDVVAGRRVGTFVSGYEGSPLGGYDLELGRMAEALTANDVTFVPGLNEEAAATAVQGTQLATTLDGATRDGVVGIWYGKAPGLDRATDAVRHGNLIGAHPRGGVVLLVGDDPAAKSSSVPCASEFALVDLAVPFLYPADSGEILDLGLHAIELSRVSGLWTALKIVTAVADGSSAVDVDGNRPLPALPAGAKRHEPSGHLLQPRLGSIERDLLTRRLRLAGEYSRLNGLNRVVGRGGADRVGVVAAGRTWLDVVAAIERLGIAADDLPDSPLRLLKVSMPYPLDGLTVHEFAEGLDEIVVVEEKRSFLETAIRDVLYGRPGAPAVTGKHDVDGSALVPSYGDLDADAVRTNLDRRLRAHGIGRASGGGPADSPARAAPAPLTLAARTPYFCSGCPHNTSTKPVDGSLVGAGIGCHAMVLTMDAAQVGTVTGLSQMGGEGLQWIGMAPFLDRDHYVQNLGDGTFDHSGSLAVRAAVAAGVNLTYRLLVNSAVAMTGGQRPASGMSVRRMVEVLLAEGVSRIIVTTEEPARLRRARLPRGVQVWDRRRIDKAMQVLATTRGVTVLLHDQECATERRRRRKRGAAESPQMRVIINERVCEGCGDCGRKSNCLSVQPVGTEFGRKTRIHQPSCNLDHTCVSGDCPAFLTVVVPPGARPVPPGLQAELADAGLPDPPRAEVVPERFGIRLAGVGGTGVVTASRVLAEAALAAGWSIRALDQTGLAQKGGAVSSDVCLSRSDRGPNRLASGECDLYLGCDLLVAADPRNLAVASAERTVAVLSTAEVPTGRMVSDPTVTFPAVDDAVEPVRLAVRTLHLVDAQALALGLFGDDQHANLLIIGVAVQAGVLPLSAAHLEQAITRNAVAVRANIQALRRGRQYVFDPAAVRAAAGVASAADEDLDTIVTRRVAELTAYQNAAYAARYAAAVDTVRHAEAAAVAGSDRLTLAVARNLYKLMAYKDEYEVARLLLAPGAPNGFGPRARVSWNLHPPVLRALGMKRKLRLGPWFRPVLRALYGMRSVRGTAFDPFGRARVRVVERALVGEYLDAVHRVVRELTAETLDAAVEVAELPDIVRGYEDIKLGNVERYRERLADLLA